MIMKHFLSFKHLLASLLLVLLGTTVIAQPATWSFYNTGANHTILVQPGTVTIDGSPIVSGDYIGVFYTVGAGPDLACAGYLEYNSAANNAMTAWGTEAGLNNGLANGEEFKWKVWRAADGAIIDMTATYQTAGFPNLGTYVTNGISAIATMTGSGPVVSFSATGDATNVSCYNACDGEIALTVMGGQTPYSFSWSNGETTQNLSGLCAGSYAVTVSDANGGTTPEPFDWTWVNTGANHTILVQPGVATIDGDPIQNGDYIGVFYTVGAGPDLACAGYVEWLGINTAVTAWGTEAGLNNGLANGETFKWKVYRASTGEVIDMDATYQSVGFPNQGTYVTNGISGLATLAGTSTQSGGAGNSTTLSFEITQPDEIIITSVLSNYDGFNVSTFGGSDGTIDLTVSGGVSPYTFAWSDGASLEDRTGLSAGTYSVTVTDANDCTSEASLELTQPLIIPLEISTSATDPTCFDLCNGTISVVVAGGIEPYSIEWTGGLSGFAPADVCAGTYSATVSDAGTGAQAQSQVISFELTSPNAIVVTADIIAASCNGSIDGAIDVSVSGGTAPYTFSWSNLASTEDLLDLAAGFYTLTVLDANDCSLIESFEITEPLSLLVSAELIDVNCNGDASGAVYAEVSGGTSPYSYTWSNGSTLSSVTEVVAGEYTLTVTDANNCEVIEMYEIMEPTMIDVLTDVSGVSCNGANDGEITVSVSGGVNPYTIAWADFPTSTNFSLTNLAPGLYVYTVTDANDCAYEYEDLITEPELLTLSGTLSDYAGFNVSIFGASDGSITTTVSGGTTPYTYSWSNGSTSANLLNIPAGSYSLTLTDANGCTAEYSANLTEPDPTNLLSISGAINHVTCNGAADGSINLTITGGTAPYVVLWSNGASSTMIDQLVAGTYAVTVTDADNNEIVGNYVVNQPDMLVLDLIPSDYNGFGVGCYAATNGFVETSITGGTAPFTFAWSNGATTSSIQNLAVGTYSLTITDANGCVAMAEASINQPTPMAASSTAFNVSCFGTATGSINLNVVGGVAPYTFVWSTGATTQNLQNVVAGTYSVTVSDANGCPFIIDRTLTEPALLTMDLEIVQEVSCFDFTNGELFANVSGGTTPYTYTWSTEIPVNGPTLAQIGSGSYSVTVTDHNGCEVSATETLANPVAIEMTYSVTNILCNGDETGAIDVTTAGGTGNLAYNWSNGASTQDLENVAAGFYTLTVSDDNFCEYIETIEVLENTAILSNASMVDLVCNGAANGSIELMIEGGTAPYAILWNTNETTSTLNGLSGGEYAVTITDANDCVLTESYSVFEPTAIEIMGQVVNITCTNDNDGSINVFVSEGTPGYTYAWSNGATTMNLTNLAGGTYVLTVTDANECTATASFDVINPELVSGEAVVNNLLCYGDDNGSINLTAQGGTSPYYYAWSTGSFDEDLNDLVAGVYEVTITDINGCQGVESFAVNQPAQLMVSHITSDYAGFGVTCFGSSDGYVELSVSGGVLPYTYLWSNGATTQNVYDIPAGDISVGVIDGNGCSISEGPEFPWSYANTGENHTVFIPSAQINGLDIQVGDYIGVFYNNNGEMACAGYIEWTGSQNAITAWGSEEGLNNGFQTGEAFSWKVWRASDGVEIEMTPVYDLVQFPNAGTYTINGISGLSSLTGSGPSVQPNLGYFINLTSPEPLTASGTVSDYNGYGVSCNGAEDASISLDIVTCIEDYEILWNTGATTQTITGLSAGNYSATVSYVFGEVTEPTPFNWTYNNTGENHSIYIPGATINGYSIAVGDYIGVFYDQNGSLECAGYVEWQGIPTGLSAWGTEVELNNGLALGEEFKWKVWRAIDGMIIDMTATYGTNFPNTNTYTTNGISGLTSLVGESSLEFFVGDFEVDFTVTEPEALTATAQVAGNACFGDAMGTVVLTVEGGVEPYTYAWSSGETGNEIANVAFGEYTITVTDANACTLVETFMISQPEALDIMETLSPVLCNGGTDGAIDITVTGGTEPYAYAWSNGSVEQSINGLSAGVYTLTLTDANGCNLVESFEITEPAALTQAVDLIHVDCFGNASGEIYLLVEGGTLPYTYSWSNNATSANIDQLLAGTYSVVVMDANNCSIEAEFVITEPTQLVMADMVTPISCFGGSNGAIDLTISGGVEPYTYVWANGATTEDLSSLSAAAYGITVVDANGCSVSDLIFVNQPTQLNVSGVISQVSCNGAADGAIDLNVTGGTAPYNYTWTGGATSQDIAQLEPGTYSVLVMDDNGCTASRNFVVTQPAPLAVTSQTINVSCYGGSDGQINQSVSGGTLPYTYAWSNGMISKNVSGLAAGNYTVTITDAKGCSITSDYTVTEPPVLSVDAMVSTWGQYNVSSFGATDGYIILLPEGGTFPYTFNWSNGATTYYQIFVGAGTYTVTVTDVKGCSVELEVELTSAPDYTPMALDFNLSEYNNFNVSCFGASDGSAEAIVSNGLAPFTYTWSNGATTSSISGLSVGAYSVTVVDATGASISGSVDLAGPDALVATATVIAPTCFGGSDGSLVTDVAAGFSPYTYAWSNGETTANLAGLAAGSYTVTLTDANDCSAEFTFEVENPAELSIDFTVVQPVCGGDGRIETSVSNALEPIQYVWSNEATTADLENLSGGLYTLSIIDANGCTASSEVELNVGNAISATAIQSNVTCNGLTDGSLSLVVEAGLAPYSFTWSNNATTQTIMDLSAGLYLVTISDANSCEGSFEFVITEPEVLTVDATVTPVDCYEGNNGAIQLITDGGTAPYSYTWSDGSTAASRSQLVAGTYGLTLSDANNCVVTASFEVEQPEQIQIEGELTHLSCFKSNDGAIDITVTGGVGPYTYNWTNYATTEDLTQLKAGEYRVIVTDANGCMVYSELFVITQPAAFIATIVENQAVDCNGGGAEIEVVVSGGTPDFIYTWNNQASGTIQSGLSAGTYAVTVIDDNGCVAEANYTLVAPPALDLTVFSSDASCYGEADGEAFASATGGQTPYTYLWSDANNTTTADLMNVPAGTYTVTVSDANNCTSIQSVTIAEPTQILIDLGVYAFATSGIVVAEVDGGFGPYTYSWMVNSVQTTVQSNFIKNVPLGSEVTLTVTDANGCTETATVTVVSPITITPNDTHLVEAFALNVNELVESSMEIYPNPSNNGRFFVKVAGLSANNFRMEILDGFGKLVRDVTYQSSDDQTVEVMLHQYASGIYMIRITDGQNLNLTKRIILSE